MKHWVTSSEHTTWHITGHFEDNAFQEVTMNNKAMWFHRPPDNTKNRSCLHCVSKNYPLLIVNNLNTSRLSLFTSHVISHTACFLLTHEVNVNVNLYSASSQKLKYSLVSYQWGAGLDQSRRLRLPVWSIWPFPERPVYVASLDNGGPEHNIGNNAFYVTAVLCKQDVQ